MKMDKQKRWDRFAAAALTGVIAAYAHQDSADLPGADVAAIRAAEYADAMMVEADRICADGD